MASPSLDIVLPLLLLLLVCSSSTERYLLLRFPRCRSPSSITATQRLDPTVKSQDPGAQPLPDGVAKRANHLSTRLPHRLNSSGGVPESDGPASADGSAYGDGGGVARVGDVDEDDDVESVRGASGPWGRPRGPTEMCAVRWIAGAPLGPVITVMRHSSPSSLPSSSPWWLDNKGPWASATRLGQP
jgi:hypothetical protein